MSARRSARARTARRAFALAALLAVAALAAACALALAPGGASAANARVRDLTRREGDVPRRIVGYGIVVGLPGTGDRSFGVGREGSPTVRSIVNLLRRFSIEVPEDRLRPRNAAAVLVTAEVSPYLRPGGRFDVDVAALGDAISLQGGQLWMTPLVSAPDEAPLATAQGAVQLPDGGPRPIGGIARTNSARVIAGGIVEADAPRPAPSARLFLREPDLVTARLVADALDLAFGAGTARLEDAGAIALRPDSARASDLASFLAAADTVLVTLAPRSRVVIDARAGTVVAGGDVRLGAAVVSHHGLTLTIGAATAASDTVRTGRVRAPAEASVEDVAAGLRAAGATAAEIGAVFDALRASGALAAEVVIR